MGSTISKQIPYGAHVILLFTLTFAAFILVILTTFSTPFINSINFMYVPSATGSTNFGAFGWCNPGYCLPNTVSYEYAPQVNLALTGGMVLWPIGKSSRSKSFHLTAQVPTIHAHIAAIVFIFFTLLAILPLLFVHESRALRYIGNFMFFKFSAQLAALLTNLAWLFSIYGWSIARRTFEAGGISTGFGPAMWLGLTAALCMLIVSLLGWPHEAWDGKTTRANGGAGARGLPGPNGDGYYHYKRTTREIVPQQQRY